MTQILSENRPKTSEEKTLLDVSLMNFFYINCLLGLILRCGKKGSILDEVFAWLGLAVWQIYDAISLL